MPDSWWSALVLVWSFVALLVADGMRPAIAIYFAHFQADFGCSAADAALFFAVVNAACFISALFLVAGGRTTTAGGSLLAAVGFILMAFANGAVSIGLLALLIGVGLGLIRTAVIASQPQYFSKYRNAAMGLVMVGPGLGRFIFPVLLSFLIHEYDWRSSMFYNAAFVLHCLITAAALRPEAEPKIPQVVVRKSSRHSLFKRPQWRKHLGSFVSVELWKDPVFLLLSLSMTFAAGCSFVFFSMIMPLMMSQAGLSPSAAAWTFGLHGVAELAGRLAATPTVQCAVGRLPVLFAVSWLLAQTAMSAPALFASTQAAFTALVLLVGLGNGFVMVGMAPCFVEIFGVEKLPVVFGWIGGLFNGLGGFVLVKIGGELAEAYSLHAAFYLATFCAVISNTGIIVVAVIVTLRQRKAVRFRENAATVRHRGESHSLSMVAQSRQSQNSFRPSLQTAETVEEELSGGEEEEVENGFA